MRFLVYLSVILLASCASNRQKSYSVTQLCPAFEAPLWRAVEEPKSASDKLLEKQKFAITENHIIYWFEARTDYIGLCILPSSGSAPGCATAYATYQLKEDDWELQEQKVTICPG